jgi:hypothetical protein
MQRTLIPFVLLALLAAPTFAGVVFEVETTDHRNNSTETVQTLVEGKNLAMDVRAGSTRSDGDAIFRGDRREMVVVDNSNQSYMVIDKEMLSAVAGQVNQAMAQVQEALKNVPEEQRAMVEEMMKKRMGDTMPQAGGSAPKSELRKTGEKESHNGYSCTVYEIQLDGRKTHELCVTPWSEVEGSLEAQGAFLEMADFAQELLDSLSQMSGMPNIGGDAFQVYSHFRAIDGFPVVTRNFSAGGELADESVLRSAERRTIDPSEFEPPAGYKRQQMPGMGY